MDLLLHARCVTTLRRCADDSVICGLTAARVHGFWLPNSPDEVHVAIAEPEVLGPEMVRSRRDDVRAHRRQFDVADRTMVDGVLTTSSAQTWFDLASVLTLPHLVAAGDSAFVTPCRYWTSAEPDLSLAAAKIALEYQGEEHATVARMRKDITRSTDLRRSGWLTLFYGPAEVFDRPWQIGPEVRHLVRQRNPEVVGLAPRIRRRTCRVVVQAPEWSRNRRPLGA